jgi:DNA-binding transcriptional ArsR family regulator
MQLTESPLSVSSSPSIDAKVLLLKHIEQIPGIRYRQLLRLAGFVNGVLTYHLSVLEKANAIKVDRKSRATRYYPATISDSEIAILKFIRHEPVRQILLFILEHEMCTFNEIVEYTGKAPSTVSTHLKRLKEGKIISVRHGEYHQLYRVVESEWVAEVISKYMPSFIDKVVDSYAETLEEL